MQYNCQMLSDKYDLIQMCAVNWPNILKDAKGKYDDINFRKLMDSIISDGVVRLETGAMQYFLMP